jgi:hypothetical protein
MLDTSLKPWLIEVNGPPQMTVDCDVDLKVKHPMIRDMIRTLFEVSDSDILTYCNSKSNYNIFN